MMHLLERHHNDRFTDYMEKFMSQRRWLKEELNRSVLPYADWKY